MDALHEHSLVLKHVTFHFHVHCMVHVLVDLFRLPVLPQQAPENTHPAHPKDLGGEPSLPGTAALACREIRLAHINTTRKKKRSIWIHMVKNRVSATAVLPYPECLPFCLASWALLARDLE